MTDVSGDGLITTTNTSSDNITENKFVGEFETVLFVIGECVETQPPQPS